MRNGKGSLQRGRSAQERARYAVGWARIFKKKKTKHRGIYSLLDSVQLPTKAEQDAWNEATKNGGVFRTVPDGDLGDVKLERMIIPEYDPPIKRDKHGVRIFGKKKKTKRNKK